MRTGESQRGIALLATLLATALMTVLVVDFTSSANLGYRSVANQANELRADYLARSGVNVGLAILTKDGHDQGLSQEPYDGFDKLWAQPFPPLQVGGGTASLTIVDEARKFNVNSLIAPNTGQVAPDVAQIMQRLLANVGAAPEVLPAIIDWIDADSVPSPDGAEADFYLKLTPPYEPRNSAMPTIGDLRMVKGVDAATFERLRQVLTVMPEQHVNVNTAPPEVLAALTPELENDPSLVKQIIEARQEQPFKSINDITNLPGLSTLSTKLPQVLGVQSGFFTITGLGSYAGARKLVYATVKRNPNAPPLMASWSED